MPHVHDGPGRPPHGVAGRHGVPEEEYRGKVVGLEQDLHEALAQRGGGAGLVQHEQRVAAGAGGVLDAERVSEGVAEVVAHELVGFPGGAAVVVVVAVGGEAAALVGRHGRGRGGGEEPARDRIDGIRQFVIAVVVAAVGAAPSQEIPAGTVGEVA